MFLAPTLCGHHWRVTCSAADCRLPMCSVRMSGCNCSTLLPAPAPSSRSPLYLSWPGINCSFYDHLCTVHTAGVSTIHCTVGNLELIINNNIYFIIIETDQLGNNNLSHSKNPQKRNSSSVRLYLMRVECPGSSGPGWVHRADFCVVTWLIGDLERRWGHTDTDTRRHTYTLTFLLTIPTVDTGTVHVPLIISRRTRNFQILT